MILKSFSGCSNKRMAKPEQVNIWSPFAPTLQSFQAYIFKKGFYLFIFRESGREGERQGEKHQCMVASPVPPTGALA